MGTHWAAYIDGPVQTFRQSLIVDHISASYLTLSSLLNLQLRLEPSSQAVTLKGLLGKVLWDGISLFYASSTCTGYLASTTEDALIESEFSHSRAGFIKVWCLQIHPFDESTHWGPSGLILARECGQTFKRLVIFTFEDYLVDSEKRDATFYSRFDLEQREWSLLSEIQSCRYCLKCFISEFHYIRCTSSTLQMNYKLRE